MDYREWVRAELKRMSDAVGFCYTPAGEIETRLSRLRAAMAEKETEAVLVVEKMDLYYFSGTAQDGVLYIPLEGPPLLMIRRETERARIESPIHAVTEIASLREIPGRVRDMGGGLPRNMGLELDVLPVKAYRRYGALFPGTRLVDAAPLIRGIRRIKSAFEIGLMKRAGKIGEEVFLRASEALREGMTEIELGGLMEAWAKRLGHEGLLRIRSLNYEAYSWHILAGPCGGIVSQSDSPMGGLGLSPAFPVGAGRNLLKARAPILVDFGICYHGYQADETRMFSIGEMEPKFRDAYRACRRIHDAILAEARPGADCEVLFDMGTALAEEMGYRDNYLGPPGLQTRFVGHGVGLELNEFPFIARGHAYPLEAGMTFALEPKMVFPGEGAVGIENTVVVTEDGCEILTPAAADIFTVSR